MGNNTDKIHLLVCRHLLRETNAVIQSDDFKDVVVQSYSPLCINPKSSQELVKLTSESGSEGCSKITIMGTCYLYFQKHLTGIPPNTKIINFNQCFNMLAGQNLIDRHIKSGAYLLTPGWLAEWQYILAEWGFDMATARSFFKESTSSIVLFDTGVYPDSSATLSDFAAYIDIPFIIEPVGLDFFRLTLTGLINECRLKNIRARTQLIREQSNKLKADMAMAFDLMADLTHMTTEVEVINKIMELFDMLFAPEQIVYASVINGRVNGTFSRHNSPPDAAVCQAWLDKGREENIWIEKDRSFYLRINYNKQTLGIIEVNTIVSPEYRQEYINMAVLIVRVCGLAIANARMFQDLKTLAITDFLTGIFNRRHFFNMAESEFFRAQRYNRPLTAIMLDIDHFKRINDTYGHASGDRVLIGVADCFRRELRGEDISGRYGGEEFVFIMPEIDQENALQAAERLRKKIMDLSITVNDQILHVTVSLGLATLSSDCPTLEALIDRCDQALHEAKYSGRNRVCVFDNEKKLNVSRKQSKKKSPSLIAGSKKSRQISG
ncbi:MAG: diguanylate cyclase [Spirochaetota bacterium]